MLSELKENIRNDKVLFFSTIINLTIVFLILEFFCISAINIKKFNDYVKTNMQIKVYLEKGITKEGVKTLEKKFLMYDEVLRSKYVSKELAMKELADTLDLDLDYSDNPLLDTITLMISETADIENVSQKISEEAGVESVDAKSEFLKKISKFNMGLRKVSVYVGGIVLVPIFILIFNMVHATIMFRKKDIEIMSLVGASRLYIKAPFLIESVLNVILATILSTMIFIPIYKVFQEGAKLLIPFISFANWQEILPITVGSVLVIGIVMSVVSAFVTIKIYLKLYGE
jgi:cell division transport system permease protein